MLVAVLLGACLPAGQISRHDAPAGPYSRVTHRFSNSLSYGNLVFTSGQVGFEGAGHSELAVGNITAQTLATLANVDLALERAGSHREYLLQVTIWLGCQPSSEKNNLLKIWVMVSCAPKSPQNAEQESPKELLEVRGGETLQLSGVPGLQVMAGVSHYA